MPLVENYTIKTASKLSVFTRPEAIGYYRLGKDKKNTAQLAMYYRPHFIHRFFMRICLGIYWENIKEN